MRTKNSPDRNWTPYGMDHATVKKIANKRSKRQRELEKPGPVTIYDMRSPLHQRVHAENNAGPDSDAVLEQLAETSAA